MEEEAMSYMAFSVSSYTVDSNFYLCFVLSTWEINFYSLTVAFIFFVICTPDIAHNVITESALYHCKLKFDLHRTVTVC